MEFNGIQWISMDFNGIQWISIDFNGISSACRTYKTYKKKP